MSDWLDCVAGGEPCPDREEPERAEELLQAASRRFVDRLDGVSGVPRPLSLTDSVVGDLGRCEAYAVSRAGGTGFPTSWPAVAGNALDAFVTHVLFEGPVADPSNDLESIWEAEGNDSLVEDLRVYLGDPDPDVVARRREQLGALARAAGTFRVAPAWMPRVEVKVGCVVDGTLRLGGRVDVMLGGPGTGAPTVLVEVKSGLPRTEHHEQLRHYMLLCALRHREMPVAGAIWYPADTADAGGPAVGTGGSVTEVHVPGSAMSAAHRVATATAVLADFWQGRPPSRSAGPQCGWCPVSAECPDAGTGPAPGSQWDRDEDRW